MGSIGVHLDTTLNALEENRFLKKNTDLIKKLAKRHPFSREELECIFIIYYKLHKSCGEQHKQALKTAVSDFLICCFDLVDSKAIDRITATCNTATGLYTSIEDFVRMLAIFIKGSLEDRMRHCYRCYTVFSFKGALTRDVMFRNMKNCMLGYSKEDDESDDLVRDLLELLMKKIDLDRDNNISLDEYRETVIEQPLLLEFLGTCLPSRLAIHTFETTYNKKRGKF